MAASDHTILEQAVRLAESRPQGGHCHGGRNLGLGPAAHRQPARHRRGGQLHRLRLGRLRRRRRRDGGASTSSRRASRSSSNSAWRMRRRGRWGSPAAAASASMWSPSIEARDSRTACLPPAPTGRAWRSSPTLRAANSASCRAARPRSDPLAEKLDEAFRFDQSGSHEGQFINIHNPPLRLVIIGAVHIAQSVIPIAQQLGYDVTVIDPRGAFATGARFPGIALHAEWPDEVIPKIGLDPRTALIALTHDPKIDDPALDARAEVRCLLHRRAGLQEDASLARPAAEGGGLHAMNSSPASTAPSASTSAPRVRPRSRCRSWPR